MRPELHPSCVLSLPYARRPELVRVRTRARDGHLRPMAHTNRKPGRCGSAGLPRVGVLGGRVPPAPVRSI